VREQDAYRSLTVKNLVDCARFDAQHLPACHRYTFGVDLQKIPWGTKTFKLPPSRLKQM